MEYFQLEMIYPIEPNGPDDIDNYEKYEDEYDYYYYPYENTYDDINTTSTDDDCDIYYVAVTDDEISHKIAKRLSDLF